MNRFSIPENVSLALKVIFTVLIVVFGPIVALTVLILLGLFDFSEFVCYFSLLFFPLLLVLIWNRKQKIFIACGFVCYVLTFAILFGAQAIPMWYEEHITIDVTPNINTQEYLPFTKKSKIIKLEDASLQLADDLPILDGATAAFPVYSAFIHATYPRSTELYDGVFEYNNTVGGYEKLAERKTDIFFGAYPSKEQLAYAEECGTTFEFTQIGSEAFVFFVHKDNPIDSLTAEQIRGIYAGEITNWKEIGGNDEPIVAFQRNEGSGSQSMLLRFMGDTPLMEPPMSQVSGFMGGIIEEVADYRSHSGSIGFSFRFYVEGIIQHPDIKLIAIDGVAPNVENIQNKTYPIVAPVYAVTWAGNDNPNVKKLLDWILSDEGQYIIEETGYVGIGK